MIHNLTPTATQVKMVYEIDFIPDSSPAAAKMKPARPIWMDVESGKIYPVFNVMKNSGKNNLFTYPNDDPNAYPAGTRQRNAWTADRDGVLLATAGHLHPGGLHTDLWLERNGAKVRAAKCGRFKTAKAAKKCLAKAPRGRGDKVHLFRSKAKYYEPAGASRGTSRCRPTRPNWKVAVKKGDVLTTTATYGTKRAAWWESMGIMVAYMADEAEGRETPTARASTCPASPRTATCARTATTAARRRTCPTHAS